MIEVNIFQKLPLVNHNYPYVYAEHNYNTIIPDENQDFSFGFYDKNYFTPLETIYNTNTYNKILNIADPFQQLLLAIVTNFKSAIFTSSNNTYQTTKQNRNERRANQRNLKKQNKINNRTNKNVSKIHKLTQRHFRHIDNKK